MEIKSRDLLAAGWPEDRRFGGPPVDQWTPGGATAGGATKRLVNWLDRPPGLVKLPPKPGL